MKKYEFSPEFKGILDNYDETSIIVYNHRAEIILIDKENYDLFMKYTWSVHHSGYLVRHLFKDAKWHMKTFHREILSFPNCDVDHINRVRLDNRQTNLRRATKQMTAFNTSKRKNNTIGFIGVIYDKRRGNFYGRVRFNGKSFYSKASKNAEQAFKYYVNMKKSFDPLVENL
jgi:hypothetical protein